MFHVPQILNPPLHFKSTFHKSEMTPLVLFSDVGVASSAVFPRNRASFDGAL